MKKGKEIGVSFALTPQTTKNCMTSAKLRWKRHQVYACLYEKKRRKCKSTSSFGIQGTWNSSPMHSWRPPYRHWSLCLAEKHLSQVQIREAPALLNRHPRVLRVAGLLQKLCCTHCPCTTTREGPRLRVSSVLVTVHQPRARVGVQPVRRSCPHGANHLGREKGCLLTDR